MIKKILAHLDGQRRFRNTFPVAALSGATAGEFVLIEPATPSTRPALTLMGQAA